MNGCNASEELGLASPSASAAGEFRLTIIDNRTLFERLAKEICFLIVELKEAWSDAKGDPVGFSEHTLAQLAWWLKRKLSAPNSLAATTTAMLVVISAALLLVLSDRLAKQKSGLIETPDQQEQIITFLPEDTKAAPEDRGIGAGSNGRVGFNSGKGEGSGPKPKRSTGGGSGGLRDPLPAQIGKPPQPSPIPAPIPKFPPVQKQALPVAGMDIDPALWRDLPLANYGDPLSKSATPSNGPGEDGGMGTVKGTGVGNGFGPGYGPGRDGNIGNGPKGEGCCGSGGSHGRDNEDPDRVYPNMQVTERARVLSKPEPQYTEDARRNLVMGTVVLRVVFSRTGEVTNIRATQALPFGLTERAIAAARLIRFRPATRDGRPVNVFMQLEYNFNLY